MFFGANTPNGFYNGFGEILPLEKTRKAIYLKGSSGNGKSTFLRKLGQAFEAEGRAVERIHCTNDPTGLDGICVRKYGVVAVDATAPHACDPALPIAVDEIFNLADFIDRRYVEAKAAELLELEKAKKPFYVKAYRYLKAAHEVYRNNSLIRKQALDTQRLHSAVMKELKRFERTRTADRMGRNRRMFATAITPQGMTSYLDSLIEGTTIVKLEGEDGMGTDRMLDVIVRALNAKGIDTESCYCSLNIDKPEHLIVSKINLCYVTENAFHSAGHSKAFEAEFVIDFSEFVDSGALKSHRAEMDDNTAMFTELLEKSMDMMAAQKAVHDEIERIYTASMDFDRLNRVSEEVIDRLLRYPCTDDFMGNANTIELAE